MLSQRLLPVQRPPSKVGLYRTWGAFAAPGALDVPFEIAVHDGEEDLEEEVDGVDQHRQQVQPRFARHCGGCQSMLPGVIEDVGSVCRLMLVTSRARWAFFATPAKLLSFKVIRD